MAVDTEGRLGSILGVWAHPDDETWLSAGLMARALAAGHRVVCVTATRGEAGFPADDPRTTDERAAIREAELHASLAALGVTDHRWLGYADGGCADVADDDAGAVIASLIAEIRPETVLTFGPDGGTGHPDHVSVCRWSTLALDAWGGPESGRPRLLYATKTKDWSELFMTRINPDDVMMIDGFRPEAVDQDTLAVHLTCDDDLLTRKVAALRAHASQIEPIVQAHGLELFRALNRDEFFRERRAEDGDTLSTATAFSRRRSAASST